VFACVASYYLFDRWDKVEMPADITIIDSTAFQGIATTQSVSKVEEGREYDLVEDELMYMLDNIGG